MERAAVAVAENLRRPEVARTLNIASRDIVGPVLRTAKPFSRGMGEGVFT